MLTILVKCYMIYYSFKFFENMKKKFFNSLFSVATLVVSALVTLHFFSVLTMSEKIEINISGFCGKVGSSSDVKISDLTTKLIVPVAEALRWGNEAILVYNEKGIIIVKPTAIIGVYLFAEIKLKQNRKTVIEASTRAIIFHQSARHIILVLWALLTLVMLILLGYRIKEIARGG